MAANNSSNWAINRSLSFVFIPVNFECRVWSCFVYLLTLFSTRTHPNECRSTTHVFGWVYVWMCVCLLPMAHVTTYNSCMMYVHTDESIVASPFPFQFCHSLYSLRDIFPNIVTANRRHTHTHTQNAKHVNSNFTACCELHIIKVMYARQALTHTEDIHTPTRHTAAHIL